MLSQSLVSEEGQGEASSFGPRAKVAAGLGLGVLGFLFFRLTPGGGAAQEPQQLAGDDPTQAQGNGVAAGLGGALLLGCGCLLGLYLIGRCVAASVARLVKVTTSHFLGTPVTYSSFSMTWCGGFTIRLADFHMQNPTPGEGDTRKWSTANLMQIKEFRLCVDLCKIICSCGKTVIVKEVVLQDVLVVYDKPEFLSNSNCEDVSEAIDKLGPSTMDHTMPDKLEVHHVAINNVGAKIFIKGVETKLKLEDMDYPDMQKTLEASGSTAGEALVILQLVFKEVIGSIIKSVIANVKHDAKALMSVF